MCFRIGRIFKLLKDHSTRSSVTQFVGFFNGSAHSFFSRSQNQLRSHSFQQILPFQTHGFRHGKYGLIPFHPSYPGQSYSSVSTGRLNDNSSGLQDSPALCVFDHSQCNTIFDTSSRIKIYQFGDDSRFALMQTGQLLQFQQRSMPDQFGQLLMYLCHNKTFNYHKSRRKSEISQYPF